jgi:glycosyltransferase involved in cell wall biosynthesis
MNKLKKVSVIIPVYNGVKFLQDSIGSILAQSYTNLEIIVVNDGSTDESLELIYKLSDSRFKIHTQENRGKIDALNKSLGLVTGDYLVFLDQDDYLPRFFIEDLYKTITSYDADFVSSSVVNIWGYNEFAERIDSDNTSHLRNLIHIINLDIILHKYFVTYEIGQSFWGKLFKSSLFANFSFNTEYYLDDRPNLYKILLKTSYAVISSDINYYHLNHPNSMGFTNFYNLKYLSDLLRIDSFFINFIPPLITSTKTRQTIISGLYKNLFKNRMRVILIKHSTNIYAKLSIFKNVPIRTYFDIRYLFIAITYLIYSITNNKALNGLLLRILFRKNTTNVFKNPRV